MRARPAALLACALLAACRPGEPPLSAVLITLDTTNLGALGCYGQPLPLTPNLDRLAAESIVFEEARTVAPLTLPAHTSMLTGLVPLRHLVRDNALLPLGADAETLAERLRGEGFQTAAFVSAVVLGAPWGLDQGFDVYDAPRGSAGGPTEHMLERRAADTVRAAVDWLGARERSRPFFLWVHGFEPHEPHAPPPRFLERAQGDPYLGEVAALDHALGKLFSALEAEHGLERLVLVVSADHGEALGDHGEPTHSVLCYEQVLRVPLFVRLPGRARAGERVERPVCVTDVTPTVLDALGLELLSSVDGRSLLDARPERGTYFESCTGYLNYGWSPIAGWVDARGKYLHGTTPEFYDLERDPFERTNRAAERPADVARATRALSELAALPRLERRSGDGPTDEMRADIEALGYAGAAGPDAILPEPLAATGLPDARDRMGELKRFYRAILRHNAGKVDEAIEDLRAIAEENPENIHALSVLATYLYGEQRAEEAIATLERIPERGRERVNWQDLHGHALEQLGRFEEALAFFEHALELEPRSEHQRENLLRAYERLGKTEEAQRLRASWERQAPAWPEDSPR